MFVCGQGGVGWASSQCPSHVARMIECVVLRRICSYLPATDPSYPCYPFSLRVRVRIRNRSNPTLTPSDPLSLPPYPPSSPSIESMEGPGLFWGDPVNSAFFFGGVRGPANALY